MKVTGTSDPSSQAPLDVAAATPEVAKAPAADFAAPVQEVAPEAPPAPNDQTPIPTPAPVVTYDYREYTQCSGTATRIFEGGLMDIRICFALLLLSNKTAPTAGKVITTDLSPIKRCGFYNFVSFFIPLFH